MNRYGTGMRSLLLIGALALSVHTRGEQAAGEEAVEDRIIRLGEIVVVARDSRNLLATPTVESVSLDIASYVLDAETIQLLDAPTLTEALDLAPHVFTETRGRKEKRYSSFRGQIYPYPDYALNGVWQRAFWEIPAFFPSIAIDRIEILRTGGAIMVGPNSGLVGAINIVPRRFDRQTTLLDLQGGSYGTFRSSLIHGQPMKHSDVTAGASYYATEGPDDENAAEDFASAFGTAGYAVSDDVHLELTAFGLYGNRELRRIQDPGRKALQKQTEEFSPYTAHGAILRAMAVHGKNSSTEFDIGYAAREADYKREQPGKPTVENDEDDREYNVGAIHARKLSERNTLRLGLQYNHWNCPEGKRFFVGQRMDVETFSGVIMDEQEWDRLTLDAGLRLTRSYYRDYTDTSYNIVGQRLASQPIQDEWNDPSLTGTLGTKYLLSASLALYAHGAVGSVDAPPGAVAEDQHSLDRETREILDGGIELSHPERGTISLGLFTTLRQNAVLLNNTEITEDGVTFNTYINSDVRQYGLEVEGRSVQLLDAFTFFGNATIMDSKKKSNDGWSDYREIPDIIAALGMHAVAGRFDANLFAKYVSDYENKRFAEDGKYHDLGGFVDINVTGGVSLGKKQRTRLYTALKNLLNDKYSTVVGYPDYGFQAFAGVQHQF